MKRRGLLVTRDIFVNGASGGVQACTAEYRALIEAAGVDLDVLAFKGDCRLTTRLWRRVHPSPYWRPMELEAKAEIIRRAKAGAFEFLFLNQVTLAPVAEEVKAALPASVKIVLLSHGLESTDFLNLIRARKSLPLSGRLGPFPQRLLASIVRRETETRNAADLVLTLSPFDTMFERWIGARDTMLVPRTISETQLDHWKPAGKRLGFVGTLDHAPNLEGLVTVLSALDELKKASSIDDLRIRIVGGPPATGVWLAKRYSWIEYLGPLPDEDLRAEAATWSAFIHPIFGVARGCSTKLATALGWGLPIITTPEGRRGYVWREGQLREADEPRRFATEMIRLLNDAEATAAAAAVQRAAATAPTIRELASHLAGKLSALHSATSPLDRSATSPPHTTLGVLRTAPAQP